VVGGRCALVCVRGRGAVGGGNMAGTAGWTGGVWGGGGPSTSHGA
jgi:hypothetical protein